MGDAAGPPRVVSTQQATPSRTAPAIPTAMTILVCLDTRRSYVSMCIYIRSGGFLHHDGVGAAKQRSVVHVVLTPEARADAILSGSYQRLSRRGKAGKVTLVGVMGKLLLCLNLVARWGPVAS